MPRDGRSVVSVHEVTQVAIKAMIRSEDTPYDSYDDFCRRSVLNDPHKKFVDDELLKAVADGRMKVTDVLEKIGVDTVDELVGDDA